MRLIATLQDEREALILSHYLKTQQIENELDLVVNNDWGDPNYGNTVCHIWIIHEEDLKKSQQIAADFSTNSSDPRFQQTETKPLIGNKLSEREEIAHEEPQKIISELYTPPRPEIPWNQQSMGRVTLNLLLLCCLLFFFTESTTPPSLPPREVAELSLPFIPVYFSPLKKNLLFDYPHAYSLVDDIVSKIESEKLTEEQPLPANIAALIRKFKQTPYWEGAYPLILQHFQHPEEPIEIKAPLFEKIRQGEWWRLISPAFLHADIFHILFNMIFLVVLGKQLEQRLGWQRYLIFVALAAIITNTSQYLMGGAGFLGFSGIICAMLTFVWVRQHKTPWEGYLLQSSTFNFTMLFLLVVLLIQLVSFTTELIYNNSVTPQIANTAHMSGLLLGFILGNLNLFAWRNH